MRAHRIAILPALAAVMLLAGPSAPAQAQGRLPGWGAPDARNEGYNNGYNRGYREGSNDARSGRATDYRRYREYRDADWGYHDRYGSRDEYKRIFRQGYEAGYREAFSGDRRSSRAPLPYPDRRGRDDGYGSWGYGGYGYGSSQVALNYGYNDGYERGVKAARSRKAFDPNREGWYRDGDRHYDRDYGSKDRYRASYREGFLRGYEEGYRSVNGYRVR